MLFLACPWGQVCSDLAVAIVGSGIAVLGALWIASLTFKRDVKQERLDREEEERKRRREREEEDKRIRERVLHALLYETQLNIEAITHMSTDAKRQFPLRRDALDQSFALLGSLPQELVKHIQRLSMLIDRYNAIQPGTTPPGLRGDALLEVGEPLANVNLELSRHLGQPTKGQR